MDREPTMLGVVKLVGQRQTRMVPRYDGFQLRSRKLFTTTDTLLKDIAAAANSGGSSQPVQGYNSPAASGTPTKL